MKSKSKIQKQLKKKNSSEIVKTVNEAKKNPAWLEVASILAGPRSNFIVVNLESLNKISDGKETLVVPGKVLSMGSPEKKLKIVALNFSENATEKLKNAGCETSNLLDEIKSNPEAKGIKVVKTDK